MKNVRVRSNNEWRLKFLKENENPITRPRLIKFWSKNEQILIGQEFSANSTIHQNVSVPIVHFLSTSENRDVLLSNIYLRRRILITEGYIYFTQLIDRLTFNKLSPLHHVLIILWRMSKRITILGFVVAIPGAPQEAAFGPFLFANVVGVCCLRAQRQLSLTFFT